MKFLFISDALVASLYENFNKKHYQDIDCVISCGDLPFYYLNFIIDALNVPCFYVPGNHDHFLEEKRPLGWINLHENVVKFKGLTIAGIGGSPFYNGNSDFQYTEAQMYWKYLKLRMKLLRHKNLDIFISHSPAYGMGDLKDSFAHRGFKSFVKLLSIYKPKLFVYGHAHLYYGVKRLGFFDQTLLINAYHEYKISWLEVLAAIKTKQLKNGVDGELNIFHK